MNNRLMKTGITVILVLVFNSVSLGWTEDFDAGACDPIKCFTVEPYVDSKAVIGSWHDANYVGDLELQMYHGGAVVSEADYLEANGAVVVEGDLRPEWASADLYVWTRSNGDPNDAKGLRLQISWNANGPFVDDNIDPIGQDLGFCTDDNGVRYQISVHENTMTNFWENTNQYHFKFVDDTVNHVWSMRIDTLNTGVEGPGSGTY